MTIKEQLAFQEIVEIAHTHFAGVQEKLVAWWTAENPLLGNLTPVDLVKMGKSERLLACVKNWQNGDMP